MEVKCVAQAPAPEYPAFEDYRASRLSRCAKIKVAVALGSLAVLGAAGTTAYHLVQQLKKPPPLRRMMVMGDIAMPIPLPKPTAGGSKCNSSQPE